MYYSGKRNEYDIYRDVESCKSIANPTNGREIFEENHNKYLELKKEASMINIYVIQKISWKFLKPFIKFRRILVLF